MIFPKKRGKEDIEGLLLLKKSLEREKLRYSELETLRDQVKTLEDRVNLMKKDMTDMKDYVFRAYYVREESTRKLKKKMEIKNALEQSQKLTAPELSRIVNLSRTRCTEYLREMESKGVVKGITLRRKRYYEVVK